MYLDIQRESFFSHGVYDQAKMMYWIEKGQKLSENYRNQSLNSIQYIINCIQGKV